MSKCWLLTVLLPAAMLADARTNPPTLLETTPVAISRGLTTEVRVQGINLRGASAVLFDQQGVTGKVLHVNELGEYQVDKAGIGSSIQLGAYPPLNQVTMEITVAPDAEIGLYRYRLVTKEGTSNTSTLSIEPYYGEVPENEPNDSIEQAMLQDEYVFLPTVIAGRISAPGDEDYFTFRARAGQELVFDISAQNIGSALQWGMELYDSKGTLLTKRRIDDFQPGTALAYHFSADGRYTIKVCDIERGGSRRHVYRLKIGEYPYLTGAYPLGVQKGVRSQIAVRGFNLGDQRKLTVEGKPSYEQVKLEDVTVRAKAGRSQNKIRVAVGDYPEVAEQENGASPDKAQVLAVPSTANGRISGLFDGHADEDYFRFRAQKGRHYIIDVLAQRLGSPLDSVIEVLDAKGHPIPRATLRAVVATQTTLSDRDSVTTGLRLLSPDGFAVGDYMMVGNEILRVEAMPRTPDDDFRFESFSGQRLGFFDTTPEDHAIDTPVYKVLVYPPGKTFPPNGLPVTTLYYRNDDGGPLYGKDSHLSFVAPADGEYLIHLRDRRGLQGEEYAYQLTVHEPAPDFTLTVSPDNPNVPRGGRQALRVTASRIDDFDGPIEVEVKDLPPGLHAPRNTIFPGEDSTVLVLEADRNASVTGGAVRLNVVGRARVNGREVARTASADDKLRYLALTEPPDLNVTAGQKEVVLEAGGTAEVALSIKRNKGFEGRVPISVLNLPPGVRVLDVGLNGVLVNEDETTRTFTLEAKSWVKPIEQPIALTGTVETRSPIPSSYASEPIVLKIVPRQTTVAGAPKNPPARPAASANQQ
ncbi:MAG TPA: hypothetical protein VEU62_02770 [Bryobacterales bacterium]|nr:hypothetical protein [Bryobacterales bacterium]